MSEKEMTPISMRLNEASISALKKEARKLSFNQDKDVSYVDLIREAVGMYISNVQPNSNRADVVDSIIVDTDSYRTDNYKLLTSHDLSSLESLNDLSDEDKLEMFGLIGFGPVNGPVRKLIDEVLNKKSVARAVLELNSSSEPKLYKRDVDQVIATIARRGAVPDMIQEGEDFIVPTFEIACNPSLRIVEILSDLTRKLITVADSAADALLKEESSNFIALLDASCVFRENSLKCDGENYVRNLYEGYKFSLRHGHQPTNIVMSPETFISLTNHCGEKTSNWELKSLVDDATDAGHFYGAKIRITNRCSPENVYFLADKAGVFINKLPVHVLLASDPRKLRGGLIAWVEIGMFVRDTMVSRIVCGTPKEEEITYMGAKSETV